MPCLWGTHNNSQVFIDVGIFDASTLNLAGAQPVGGNIAPPKMFKALIDTGAQKTMISTNVVTTLGMKSVGKIGIQGVGPNVHYHNGYLFHVAFVIALVTPGQIVSPGQQVNAVIYMQPTPIYGAEITSTGGVFDVLLGMDVIGTGSLKIEGNGTFSFSM